MVAPSTVALPPMLALSAGASKAIQGPLQSSVNFAPVIDSEAAFRNMVALVRRELFPQPGVVTKVYQ